MRLRDLYDRLIQSRNQYWDIPKERRIESGLRPEVGAVGYSGDWADKAAEDLIIKDFRGVYPITFDETHAMISEAVLDQQLPNRMDTSRELVDVVEVLVANLEKRVEACMNGSEEAQQPPERDK